MVKIINFALKYFSPKPVELEEWEPAIDYEFVSIADMKFIFEQTDKFLSHSIRVHSSNLQKSNYILTFCMAVLSGQSVYIFNNYNLGQCIDEKLETVMFGCIYILILSINLMLNIIPTGLRMTGNKPDKMINPALFSDTYDDTIRSIYLYRSEIISYKISIELNDLINRRKSKRLLQSIICLLLYPFILILIFTSICCHSG